ncbi:MAG TPA: endonuclease/exonuclease/phosphatase family protein [Burkholderiaceae bacterium]|nr:endonuclease/exonuclease/phosphatase family protein [Burkholderiaceae bacterium]
MKIKVATYNIHKGVSGISRRSRIHDVRLALHTINADVVFLQEVQDRNERLARRQPDHPRGTQLDFLATSGYEFRAYGMNAIYPHGHHGNAILSRHAISHFTNHDISDHALEKRGMLHAEMPLGGGSRDVVHLICVHLGLIKRSRLRQASFVSDFVEQEIPAGSPLIIAGDFNDWQRRVDGELRRRLGVVDVAHDKPPSRWIDRLLPWSEPPPVARTFPSFAPWLTLDRIYIRGFKVHSTWVPGGRAWAARSDHAPLVAELEAQ